MKWTLLPLAHMLRGRLLERTAPPLESAATRTWEIAAAEETIVPPAIFLPGQIERVTGWAFAPSEPERELAGGITVTHAPTRACLVREAWLIDGVLYRDGACAHLQPRSHRVPRLHARRELARGALCCTPGGNRYFGTWLMDDCPLYALARAEGTPIGTDRPISPHMRTYESWLRMNPERVDGAFIRELVVFSDIGQNQHKARRFAAMRDSIASRVNAEPHPGVFLLRGRAGERRVLRNEHELAARLAERRGLRVIDPLEMDVPSILSACAGARLVVGVEGSGLVHGVLMLQRGGTVLTLQPPNRFCLVYKHLADRDGQHFAFVVGQSVGEDFHVDPDEVERTLDLVPRVG
jgi:hypothetical protein